MCVPITTGQELWHITQVLADVPNWLGLADLLDIRSSDIEADCAHHTTQAACQRRTLVLRYCDSQPTKSTCEVTEDVAEALEQMKHNRQAQRLREKFGKSVAKTK